MQPKALNRQKQKEGGRDRQQDPKDPAHVPFAFSFLSFGFFRVTHSAMPFAGLAEFTGAVSGLVATHLALWKRLIRGQFCKRKGMHIFPYCH